MKKKKREINQILIKKIYLKSIDSDSYYVIELTTRKNK